MGTLVAHCELLVEELSYELTPWNALRRLALLPNVFFLDSALRHPTLGRYSYLTADPFRWVEAHGDRVTVSDESRPRHAVDPFAVLAELLARHPMSSHPELPPFQGGVAGLFGYDLCHHIEQLPRSPIDEFQTPDLAVGFYDWVLAWDHHRKRCFLMATGESDVEPHHRIEQIKRRLDADPVKPVAVSTSDSIPVSSSHPVAALPGLRSSFDRPGYLNAVRRAVEYVHAGDCFQVNIAQRLLMPAQLPSIELYRRLRERNPAPFAGYFDLGLFIIASASPERFLFLRHGDVETRPIKGTRPRGRTPLEDEARIRELLASVKDRAENVMIVDLLRNDLGRVCRFGSVKVADLCRVETYQYVHHLVSEVRGRLREGTTAIELLRAAFPGGSVTGAPKVRAMQIIAELEPTVRGPYCGSLGFIGFDGSMDTNILIRTFTIGRGWVQFPVGGGIVADSEPEREYQETWHKAEGLLRALT
jgi:para-aminobenzoate synthetase component 1